MADHGEVALRMLDPQWVTLHGTVRQWVHQGRLRLRMESVRGDDQLGGGGPGGRGRPGAPEAVFAGRRGPFEPPQETETVARFWIERGGRSRFEHLSLDGVVQHAVIDDGRSVLVVPATGPITRSERIQRSSQGVWTGDPRILLANVRLSFGRDDLVLGRAAVRAEARPPAEEAEPIVIGDPVARAAMSAGIGDVVVDVESGLVVRYEARDENGRPISRHEFVTIEVDEPFADDVFAYEIPPERTERTPTEIQLEMLERAGIDVSAFDRTDVAGVREAVDEHFRRVGEQSGRTMRTRGRRPLTETVAPLGPPPDDEDGARLQIADALRSISPDGRPMAGRIERGELLDALDDDPRVPPPAFQGHHIEVRVIDLVFLRADEALVDFEVRLSRGPIVPNQGRVVQRDGRWLVSYDTIARMQLMAGRQVPSLLHDPADPGDPDDERGRGIADR